MRPFFFLIILINVSCKYVVQNADRKHVEISNVSDNFKRLYRGMYTYKYEVHCVPSAD